MNYEQVSIAKEHWRNYFEAVRHFLSQRTRTDAALQELRSKLQVYKPNLADLFSHDEADSRGRKNADNEWLTVEVERRKARGDTLRKAVYDIFDELQAVSYDQLSVGELAALDTLRKPDPVDVMRKRLDAKSKRLEKRAAKSETIIVSTRD